MLDPRFKDLSMVGNYVGHASTIEIIVAYENQFLVPTLVPKVAWMFGGPFKYCA
jgi:hypothetical protein